MKNTVVAGQESWEREDTRIEVEGYKWFGKPRNNQTSQRGGGGGGGGRGWLFGTCMPGK